MADALSLNVLETVVGAGGGAVAAGLGVATVATVGLSMLFSKAGNLGQPTCFGYHTESLGADVLRKIGVRCDHRAY
jgi:hypothetical protein